MNIYKPRVRETDSGTVTRRYVKRLAARIRRLEAKREIARQLGVNEKEK